MVGWKDSTSSSTSDSVVGLETTGIVEDSSVVTRLHAGSDSAVSRVISVSRVGEDVNEEVVKSNGVLDVSFTDSVASSKVDTSVSSDSGVHSELELVMTAAGVSKLLLVSSDGTYDDVVVSASKVSSVVGNSLETGSDQLDSGGVRVSSSEVTSVGCEDVSVGSLYRVSLLPEGVTANNVLVSSDELGSSAILSETNCSEEESNELGIGS